MLRKLSFFPVLLFLNLDVICAENERFSTLNNAKGQTPCQLRDQLLGPCPTSNGASPSRRQSNTTLSFPPLTPCTCNNVFFNVWSGCLLTQESEVFPNSDDLTGMCKSHSLSVNDGYRVANATEVDLPKWAQTSLPTNTTFDPEAAFELAEASRPRKWTLFQILLPVGVGLVTLGLVILAIFFYRRMRGKSQSRFRWPRIFRGARRIQRTSRQLDLEDEDVSNPSFGHDRASLSSYSQSLTPSQKRRTASQGSLMRQSLRNFRRLFVLPWGSKTQPVKHIARGQKFAIDKDQTTQATDSPFPRHDDNDETLDITQNLHYTATNYTHETIYEQDDEELEDGLDSDERAGDEATTLISPEQRSQSLHFDRNQTPTRQTTMQSRSTGTTDRSRRIVIPSSPVIQLATPSAPPSHTAEKARRPDVPPPPRHPAPLPPSLSTRTNPSSLFSNPVRGDDSFKFPTVNTSEPPSLGRSQVPFAALRPGQANSNDLAASQTSFQVPHTHTRRGSGDSRNSGSTNLYTRAMSPYQTQQPSSSQLAPPSAHAPGFGELDVANIDHHPSQASASQLSVNDLSFAQTRTRNVAHTNFQLSDAAMLFPGPVLGAGYMGRPT